jgi:septal ring factor EnvC (AmiA/AmiB activator)
VLESEQGALKKAQSDYEHQRKLDQEGSKMLEEFDRGTRKQKELFNIFDRLGSVKVAFSVGKRLEILMNGSDHKNTRSNIEGALHSIRDKLKKLDDEIREHERNRDRLKKEIADCDARSRSLYNRIAQIENELKRLRLEMAR